MEPRSKLLAFVLALETSLLVVQPRQEALAQDKAAGPPRATLQWVREAGAQGCIDGRELARRVENKLRRPVFDAPRDAQLLIEGTAARKGEGYRAELRTFDTDGKALGSREVLSERTSCEELSETVAVVLAVMIDPAGALNPPTTSAAVSEEPELPPPPPPVVEQPTPKPCPVPAPPPTPPAPVEKPPAVVPEVSLFARADYGHVPAFIWGGGVAFELALRRFGGLRLEGVAFAERSVEENGPANTGVNVRVFYGSALYCPLWMSAGRFRGSACAGIAVGALQSQGFGLPNPNDGTSPLFDGVLDVHGALRLWRGFGLYAGGGLSVAFARTSYSARLANGSSVELSEQPAVAGRFDLGLGTRF